MKIEHVAIWTRDLERMKAFYETYLGASAEATTPYHNPAHDFRSYFLRFESGARLELMQKPALAEGPGSSLAFGYAHLAVSCGSASAVDALTQRLVADGYECIDGPRTTGDGYYESVILDPDGNRIEITV